jgi:hypothetical protein
MKSPKTRIYNRLSLTWLCQARCRHLLRESNATPSCDSCYVVLETPMNGFIIRHNVKKNILVFIVVTLIGPLERTGKVSADLSEP